MNKVFIQIVVLKIFNNLFIYLIIGYNDNSIIENRIQELTKEENILHDSLMKYKTALLELKSKYKEGL